MALAGMLEPITDLRVYAYVADTFRPPGVVIAQPDVDFADGQSGYCRATWMYPLTIVVSRSNDREAQSDLSRLLLEVARALDSTPPPGVFSVEPLDGHPTTANVAGQGGNATSPLTGMTLTGSAISLSSTASGGNGGSTLFGTSGRGGDAVSTILLPNLGIAQNIAVDSLAVGET